MIVKDASYGGYVLAPLGRYGDVPPLLSSQPQSDYVDSLVQKAIDEPNSGGASPYDPISPDNAAGTGSGDSGGGVVDLLTGAWNKIGSGAKTAAEIYAEEERIRKQIESATGGSGGATGLQTPPGVGPRIDSTRTTGPGSALPGSGGRAVAGGGGVASPVLSDPAYVAMLARTGGRIGGGTGIKFARQVTPAMDAALKANLEPRPTEVITKTPYGQPSSISLPKIGLGVALGYLLFFK